MAYREVQNPIHFPALEQDILNFWEEKDIFQKSIDSRAEDKPFTFYEGPPTANGKPGIHHVISRSIKDFVCRYKTMQGYRVNRKAGWDTHGLPVEIEIEKALGLESKDQIEDYGVAEFNKKCRDSVFKYVKEWNELTRRIGYWVDLENPYVTYTNEYIETVWYLLAELWKKDLLYRGFKILPHCPRCETALSSHETSLGYKEVSDRAITVKFELVDQPNHYILAWTTTPWTLPGNVALAVGVDIEYVKIKQTISDKDEFYYIAENRLEMIEGDFEIIEKVYGKDLENLQYKPLFDFVNLADEHTKAYFVALADFVTTEDGTGVVHTAVMYGEDDYRLGTQVGLPAVHTVDVAGHFNEHVSEWKGMFVKDPETEKQIIIYLKTKGLLYKTEKYTHSYPHCWRCDSPLLYYAKRSWYIKTTAMKDQLVENNQKIQWYPKEVGEGRFGQWLENNIDWAISRDRYWGTPLPIWVCNECGKQHAIGSIDELKKTANLDSIEDLHKPYIDDVTWKCSACEDGTMVRTREVIDCWFDSGAMPFAQMHYPFENSELFEKNFPADFIAEGVDQTRGWFYSLLAISTLITGKSSYKSCISIELILDKNGQKMSKSKGNAVDPFKVLNKYGADALRWYLFTVSPPWVPTRFDEEGVQEIIRKFFGTLGNTYGFFVLYANIDGFIYDSEKMVPIENRPEIDRWLISRLNELVEFVTEHIERYEVTKTARMIQEFVLDDLSNWYIRQNRRRFWKSELGDDKVAAYQTLFETLFTIVKLIAPFSPFLAEEIYQNLNNGIDENESVHLCAYPQASDQAYQYKDELLMQRMKAAKDTVSLCRSARNDASIRVRQPLEKVVVFAQGENKQKAVEYFKELILTEVNIRNLEFAESQSDLVSLKAKPNFKKLGPKFGSQVNQVAEIIRQFTEEEIQQLKSGKALHISVDNGKHGDVELEDIELNEEAKAHYVVQSNMDLTIAIDTKLSEDLVAEGLAREFINRVQNMRKEAGFQVTDRIFLFYETSGTMHRALRLKNNYIAEEVLAVDIKDAFEKGEYSKEWEIENETVKVGIKRQLS